MKISDLNLWFILLAAFAIILVVDADTSCTDTTTITCTVRTVVKVTAPDEDTVWMLNPTWPGTYTKVGSLNVKANRDWQVTVVDTNPKTSGYMTEWYGDGYSARKLNQPVKISAENEVTLTDSENKPIKTGARTSNEGQNFQVTISQEISEDEIVNYAQEALPGDKVYRIALTFVGSAVV